MEAYRGDGFARSGVVFVSVGFRLGRLGWFAHPALTETRMAEGEHPIGNYGLADQSLALTWVQENIELFGGDPGNVTIMGQSSGGIDVLMHCLSTESHTLFHKAICQSGGGWYPPYALADAERDAEDHLRARAGVETYEDLCALTAEQLCLPGPIYPIADGHCIADQLTILLAGGSGAKVPLLIGATSGEEISLVGTPPHNTLNFAGLYSDDQLVQLAGVYPGLSTSEALARAYGNTLCVAPARWVARNWPASAYLYLFDQCPPADSDWAAIQGAWPRGGRPVHGDEIPYVFGHDGRGTTAADDAVQSDMHGRWIEFCRSGSPDQEAGPVWTPYDAEEDNWLVFRKGASRIDSGVRREQLDFAEMFVRPVDALGGKHDVAPLRRVFSG